MAVEVQFSNESQIGQEGKQGQSVNIVSDKHKKGVKRLANEDKQITAATESKKQLMNSEKTLSNASQRSHNLASSGIFPHLEEFAVQEEPLVAYHTELAPFINLVRRGSPGGKPAYLSCVIEELRKTQPFFSQ